MDEESEQPGHQKGHPDEEIQDWAILFSEKKVLLMYELKNQIDKQVHI